MSTAVMAVMLSGCIFTTAVEDMLTLPQLPMEYAGLSEQISKLISDGYEYASPMNGQNIQSVQMIDLNHDEHEEAVVFLRRPADEKPLKIMVFRPESDTYQHLCTIESSGSAIDSVVYADLTGDGTEEMIVGWRISSDVQTVAAYAIGAKPTELMSSSYTRYSVEQLRYPDVYDLAIFHTDVDTGKPLAELYSWDSTEQMEQVQCKLSFGMAELMQGSVICGCLADDTPALFVTGVDDANRAVTDVLYYKADVGLCNAVLDRQTGLSKVTAVHCRLTPKDIDGDGFTEIPRFEGDEPGDGLVSWIRCDKQGAESVAETTYHCISEGWYLRLQADWRDRIQVNTAENGMNDRQTVFLLDDVPVMSIYAITGENRENRALLGNRVILKRQTTTIYSGEILKGAHGNLTDDFLHRNFNLIVSAWTANAS